MHNKLLDRLFVKRQYQTDLPPVLDGEKAIEIGISFNVHQILEVSSRHQYIRMWTTVVEQWVDEFLTWNPEKYEGLDEVFVDEQKIWQPDSRIIKLMDIDPEDMEHVLPVSLKSQKMPGGKFRTVVTKKTMAIYTVACEARSEHFPWDIQHCNISLASWTAGIEDLRYYFFDSNSDIKENHEWQVLSINHFETESCIDYLPPFGDVYVTCYSQLDFELIYGRRPVFYSFGLVLPTVIITQASYFGIFFWSDSSGTRGEKFTLGVSSILALSVNMLIVGDLMPRASNPVPHFNTFVLGQIFLLAIALLFSSLLIQLHSYGQHGPPMPRFLKWYVPKELPKQAKNDQEIPQEAERVTPTKVYKRELNDEIWILNHHQLRKNIQTIKTIITETLSDIKNKEERSDFAEEWLRLVNRLERHLFILVEIVWLMGIVFYLYNSFGTYILEFEELCEQTSPVETVVENYCAQTDLNSKIMRFIAKLMIF